jgi:hypothetical protein
VCWRRLSPRRLGTQVGRAAFKRRVTPLEGDHVFVLPYASCLSTFQAPGWGIPAVFLPCRRGNATPRELVPFGHHSASRIFIILAGVEAGLSRSSTSRAGSWVTLSCGVRGRGRSLALWAGRTSTTRGWSTAGVGSLSVSSSSAWLPVPPPAGRRLPRRVHGRTA